MIKEFFEMHDHLCFKLQHIGRHNGKWQVRIYNTTLDFACTDPIYEYTILDSEINNSNVDFETMIMTPSIDWWKGSRSFTKYDYTCQIKEEEDENEIN